jgi:Ca2+ transporting ATPase
MAGLTAKQLKDFVLSNVNNRLGHDVLEKVMPEVRNLGGCEGITEKLGGSLTQGLNPSEIKERQEKYGKNYVEPDPPTPFWRFCLDALEDETLQLLLFFAALGTTIGSVIPHERECYGFIDGLAIFGTVAIVVLVGAFQEKDKENRFRALSAGAADELVNVIRSGHNEKISVKEVVVGDTIVLSTGDIICADGIVYERNTLSIFEGPLTGESHPIAKGQYEFKEDGTWEMPKDEDLKAFFPDSMTLDEMKQKYKPPPKKTPVIFAGTNVQDGEGKMIVIAVGANTYQEGLLSDKKGKDEGAEESEDDGDKRSILQKKLNSMTMMITKCGLVMGVGTVTVLMIRFGIFFAEKTCCYEDFNPAVHIMQIIHYIILGIVIFVVAVPEGLPLAVTIALAFSVGEMLADQNQVKTSSAAETMGSATTICSDKTGTLTTSKMTVMKTYVIGEQMDPAAVKDKVTPDMKNLIQASMTINTSEKSDLIVKQEEKKPMQWTGMFPFRVQTPVPGAQSFFERVKDPRTGKGMLDYSGNATECAMLKMVNQLDAFDGEPDDRDQPYRKIRKDFPESMPGRSAITFSSKRKRMSTLVPMPQGSKSPHRLYCKGASEMVLELCTKVAEKDGSDKPITEDEREKINKAIDDFANMGLRTIAVAYRNLDESPVKEDGSLPESVEAGLTLVCIVGIEDPLRVEVVDAIKTCNRAGITVRMVTGDNLTTAKAISRKANILTDKDNEEFAAMTGEKFRMKVLKKQNMDNPEQHIDQAEFDKVWPQLRVLARSTPTDKLVLVTGIQNSRIAVQIEKEDELDAQGKPVKYTYTRQVVAVTGDGTNDAPALKQADVGFAMYINGTQVAQKAADIVVMDDNFDSIVQAVKWGRSVYDNICRFLQFQLTVNIVACTIACIGSAVLTASPIAVLQLLWVNLIMDSFASLALATENPKKESNGIKKQVLSRYPYSRTAPLLSKIMVRNMFGHALFQLGIMLFIIFAMGDVCEQGETRNVCAGKPWKDDGLTLMRSGRPIEYDKYLIPEYDKWNCVPKYNKDLKETYMMVKGLPIDGSGFVFNGVVPLRSANYDVCSGEHGGCGSPSQHMTMVFHAFVFCQVFNEINARKLHNEINVFKGLDVQPMFAIVWIGTVIVQFLLVELPGLNTTFNCTNMEPWQHIFCFLCGFAALPWNLVIHFIPTEWIPLGHWAGGIDESELDQIMEDAKKEGAEEGTDK